MIRVFQLFFLPGVAWEKIAVGRQKILITALLYLLPLVAMAVLIDGYALRLWGMRELSGGAATHYDLAAIGRFELIHAGVLVTMVLAGGLIVKWLAESFQVQTDFASCFNLAVFGFTPVLIAHMLGIVPFLNNWITAGLGMLGCAYVLYQGVGAVLQPDQTKGFGIYILCVITFVLLTAMELMIGLMALRA
jgi:hypothetical protein